MTFFHQLQSSTEQERQVLFSAPIIEHALKGDMQGRWSVSVNGNWRVTFEFRDGNAYVLDYEDYH